MQVATWEDKNQRKRERVTHNDRRHDKADIVSSRFIVQDKNELRMNQLDAIYAIKDTKKSWLVQVQDKFWEVDHLKLKIWSLREIQCNKN